MLTQPKSNRRSLPLDDEDHDDVDDEGNDDHDHDVDDHDHFLGEGVCW